MTMMLMMMTTIMLMMSGDAMCMMIVMEVELTTMAMVYDEGAACG